MTGESPESVVSVLEADSVPRCPRFCPAGIPVHAIQRGNNRNVIFASDSDRAAHVHWLEAAAVRFDVAIHGWVLMTNHVHLLLTPGSDDAVSRLFQCLGRLYVRYFNFAYARSGTLFDGRFKSSPVQQERYFPSCLRYIELNPVRAGMVTYPGHYRWSSYRAHAHGLKVSMWTGHECYLALDRHPAQRQARYRALTNEVLDQEVISKIRHCASAGLVLGNEEFRSQVASLRA